MNSQSGSLSKVAAVAVVVLLGMAGLYLWTGSQTPVDLSVRLTDIEAETLAGNIGGKVKIENVDIEGIFVEFKTAPMGESAAWPQFRGGRSDGLSEQTVALADSWPEGGPPVLWQVELGEGHAGAAIFKGRVFVLDYDEDLKGDALRCFSLEDGTEFWRRSYRAPTKRNHGVSRTVPAVTDKYTVTIGPRCFVMCVDTETGAYLWGLDMVKEYGTKVPLWYTGQCPLIVDDTVILAPAGTDVAMMGVDCATGEVLWSTPNTGNYSMAHSSVIPMDLLGVKTFVYAAVGGIFGVSGEEGSAGEMLWSTPEWSHAVISPSPVEIPDDRIFLTAGYGGGSMMLQLKQDTDQMTANVLYGLSKKVFGCEQQTPLFYKNHLFGILPKDASKLRGQFVCLNLDGEIVWTSGKQERFGLGPFLIADEKVYLLDDDGEFTMMRASLDGYEQLGRCQIVDGHDAWAPLAMADGLMLLRDSYHLLCVDLREGATGSGLVGMKNHE